VRTRATLISREIHVLKNAERSLGVVEGKLRTQPILVDDDDLTRLDFADDFRVNQIEGAGLGRENIRPIETPQHQRTKTKRIAHADDFALTHDHE
jgi:hypothetical protein